MAELLTDPVNILKILLVMISAYLLGSINVAIVVTKLFTGKDIRTMGSGNGGFTNVVRCVGMPAGIITFVGDFLKCVIAVLVGGFVFSTISVSAVSTAELAGCGKYLAGLCCFLGHIFPVYFKFKGGKGVVTMAALAAVINFPVFIISFIAFAIVFLCTKIVSVSSIISAVVLTLSTFLVTYFYDCKYLNSVSVPYVITVSLLTLAIATVMIIKHKDNIKRLMRGEEKKLSLKKKSND